MSDAYTSAVVEYVDELPDVDRGVKDHDSTLTLIDLLQHPGQWGRTLWGNPGRGHTFKQFCEARGIQVETATRGAFVYLRIGHDDDNN
jgi:hypothetical protein